MIRGNDDSGQNMLNAILKKEILGHTVSFRFIASSLILLALTGLAAWVGTEDYLLRAQAHSQIEADYEAELQRIHVYSFIQPVVARPPEPLSIIDRGFEGRLSKETRVDILSIPIVARESFRGNEFMASFLSLDFTTIVRLVFGLLALLLTFDAAVGEKESGNLKLVLASGVRRSTVIFGKFLGAFASLLIPLALCSVTILAILRFRGQIELSSDLWWRLAGLMATYLFYISLMIFLGLALSLTARSTSASLVLSLFAWLIIVILIPQAAVAVTAEAMEAQSDFRDVEREVDRLEEDLTDTLNHLHASFPMLTSREELGKAPVVDSFNFVGERRRYGDERYYDTLAQFRGHSNRLILEHAEKIHQLRHSHLRKMQHVERYAQILSYPSPAFLLDRISEAFAGTSAADFDRFFVDARKHRQDLIAYLEEKNAFDSWRWFTDDPVARPWTELVDEHFPDNPHRTFRVLSDLFQDPQVQDQVRAEQERFESDPERLLSLDDFPRPEEERLDLLAVSNDVWREILFLLAFNGALAILAVAKFEKYRLGWV